MKRTRTIVFSLFFSLFLTACGGSQLTYKVLGTADQATVAYTNAKGQAEKTTVTLPWETSFGIGDKFDFAITVNNASETGSITCEVWVNEQRAGGVSGVKFAECTGSFEGSRRERRTRFSGRQDREPENAVVTMDQQGAVAATAIAEAATKQAAAATAKPTATPVTSGNSLIAFISRQDDGEAIFVIEPDGSNVTRITQEATLGGSLAWSPDGNQLVFKCYPDDNADLCVVNADGTGFTRLTNHPNHDTNPSWSADSQYIAFTSKRETGRQVYKIGVESSEITQLTHSEGVCAYQAWSPDGRRIAYVCSDNTRPDVYVMNADGSGQTRLTSSGKCSYPFWSPDGRQLAYACSGKTDVDVYVVNVDGSGHTRLTGPEGIDQHPTWSPDGSQIAFVSLRSGSDVFVIKVMRANGDDIRRITDDDVDPRVVSWSPEPAVAQ